MIPHMIKHYDVTIFWLDDNKLPLGLSECAMDFVDTNCLLEQRFNQKKRKLIIPMAAIRYVEAIESEQSHG